MFIGIVETCGDYALANILLIVRRVMTIFQILVPIVAIIALVKTLIRLTLNPEDKKLKGSIKAWLISLVVFFFLPVIIDATMGLLDDNFSISACWNYAKDNATITNSYIMENYELKK